MSVSPFASAKVPIGTRKLLLPLPLQVRSAIGLATVGERLTAVVKDKMNRSETIAPLPSLAVILTIIELVPVGGVPLKVRVPGTKVSQEGKAEPSSRVAV